MKRDSHYYALLAFCRACGFKKESAHLVAYASQFVDDAKINLMYIANPVYDDINYDLIDGRPAFFDMATAHSYFRISTFNYESMVNNTCAFHFVPGCKGESFTKKLRCMEESVIILEILNDVLKTPDLIKLGLVLHAYADTFSHQGFSGLLSKVNDINNCKAKSELYLGLRDRILYYFKLVSKDKYDEVFDNVVPAYGHGLALDFPDIPYLVWSYEYDYSDEFICTYKLTEVDNKLRYRRAFEKIKIYLENYLRLNPQYLDPEVKFNNFDYLFETLLLENTDRIRELNWISTLITLGLFAKNDFEYVIYEDNKWLKEAFKNYNPQVYNCREVAWAELGADFPQTNWFKFYLAVKWYKQLFFNYCQKYGLVLPH
ncbi:MAG TPA: hypothetical protein GXX46_06115 [Peptococcaceae bacterium]|nr:hypothetical protein [Peptococcaceae bacterium]